MLQDLDYGQWRARKDRLELVGRRVKEADVVIHVVEIAMAEALDVLGQGDSLLDVAVMSRVAGKDGIVYNDTVNRVVGIGAAKLFL